MSDNIRAGKPLLELNLLKPRMNAGADMSGTSSKWIAPVMQHVYSAIHTLDWPPPEFLTYKGPAKSALVFVKGGACHTWKAGSGGSGGGGGTRQDFPLCLWQMMQLQRIHFTMLLPLITQNCDLNSARVSLVPL